MKIIILGGDGYLGWPTAMYLSARGHEVWVVDNYFRRQACLAKNVPPLFSNPNLHERVEAWADVSGKNIHVEIGDICNFDFIFNVFKKCNPDAIIHYAEQPSAPYSMIHFNIQPELKRFGLMVSLSGKMIKRPVRVLGKLLDGNRLQGYKSGRKGDRNGRSRNGDEQKWGRIYFPDSSPLSGTINFGVMKCE